MRVMCAIDRQGGAALLEGLAALLGADHDLLLVHVIDTGPRHSLEAFLRGPAGPRGRRPHAEPLDAAESEAGERVLGEARLTAEGLGFRCEAELARGEPGDEILRRAVERAPDLLVVGGRRADQEGPRPAGPIEIPRKAAAPPAPSPAREPAAPPAAPHGPPLIGHISRFVVDHAKCSVLLVRSPPSTPA